MTDATDRLLHRLDLRPATTSTTAPEWHGEAGENALNLHNRLFGGMVVAQTIVAAGRSHPDRRIHSVQQVFLRGGRADIGLRYRVETLFSGRTYESARVEVHQGDDVISHAQIGFTGGIESPDRQGPPPPRGSLEATVNRDELRRRPRWEDQPVECRIDPAADDDGDPTLEMWIRPAGALPADPLLHQAVLAYASDRSLMQVAWKPHTAVGGFKGATLDHTIWFHRPVDFGDWHSYTMASPSLSDGRGLVHGQIHSRGGTLVASTAQQGTFRPT